MFILTLDTRLLLNMSPRLESHHRKYIMYWRATNSLYVLNMHSKHNSYLLLPVSVEKVLASTEEFRLCALILIRKI